LAFASDDEMFHSVFYDWLIARGVADELLQVIMNIQTFRDNANSEFIGATTLPRGSSQAGTNISSKLSASLAILC
jgi:hypothetical protein